MGLQFFTQGIVVKSLQVGGGDNYSVTVADMTRTSHTYSGKIGLFYLVALQEFLHMTGHHIDHAPFTLFHMGTCVYLVQDLSFFINEGNGTLGSPDIDSAKYSRHGKKFKGLRYVRCVL